MDRIYRPQRYIYDFTRKIFLPGRDLLLGKMNLQPGERVLEVGCGTGRNLIELSRLYPGVLLFGLDISEVMLELAREKTKSSRCAAVLARGSAENFSLWETFGLDRPFDRIFFSYSLSMIPDWDAALTSAGLALRPGGGLYVVDFGSLTGWPGGAGRLLRWWLGLFRVRPEPGVPARLRAWSEAGRGRLETLDILGGYAFFAGLTGFGSQVDRDS
ncbi:MAG: class I SAM-dependent methyltransferase [Pseudomonadota bacterium]